MWSDLFFAAVALLFVMAHGYTMRRDREMWRNRNQPCNVLSRSIRHKRKPL